MTPGTYDLNLYRGDTWKARFQLYDVIDGAQSPVDLTGATVAAEIRDRPNGLTIVELDCVITLPNIIDVAMTPAMWTDAPTGTGAWDLEITYGNGDVHTAVAGKVTITADVTGSQPVLQAARTGRRSA
jgi:hypothetical protein